MKLKPIVQNKKAGYLDLFLFMIVAFTVVLISAIFIYMNTQVTTQLRSKFQEMDATGERAGNYTQILDNTLGALGPTYSTLRWISFFLIMGMMISVFIGSYLVTTKPVFFIPYIFITFIAIIVAAEISNAYELLTLTEDLGPVLVTFIGSNFILRWLPIWVSVIGIGGGIIMFVKMRYGEEFGYG